MAVNLTPPSRWFPVAGVRLGSTCAAIKSHKRDDLTVIALDAGSQVAGVFTQNKIPAAPVIVCREHLAIRGTDSIRGLIINAGIANAGTGASGLRNARHSCRLLADSLACQAHHILPFSTGVIIENLPMQRYADGIKRCITSLSANHWLMAANAIMTTDTVIKGISKKLGNKTITGIAKGSGMVHPNMATMLAFVATDAAISSEQLARWQKQIVTDTFNAISVDRDTSTNDSFILIATGQAGAASTAGETRAIKKALTDACGFLAEAIIRDGEGARKLITIRVDGGHSRRSCRYVAESVATSLLVKTALAAGDANVGRLLMAIGNTTGTIDSAAIELYIDSVPVIQGGIIHPQYDEAKANIALAKDEILINISIGNGHHSAHYKTCDLTHRYLEINADYRS